MNNNKKIEKHLSCGIIPVFVNEKNEREFLLVEAHHGGISFPKGYVEEGETFLQTAERELFEETGLVCIEIMKENMISEHYTIIRPQKIINKTVHYFIGFVGNKNVSIQPEEIKNCYWLDSISGMEKVNYNDSKQVFKEALALLGKK